jgi:hypothetical protein
MQNEMAPIPDNLTSASSKVEHKTEKQQHAQNFGLPIPSKYNQDKIAVLPQDPNNAFAYWELSGGGLERARIELGFNAPLVLVIKSGNNVEYRIIEIITSLLPHLPNTKLKLAFVEQMVLCT